MKKNYYTSNRIRLVASLPKNSSAVIIAGNAMLSRNADTTYPFRQDSNILYLSGIERPGVVLFCDILQEKWFVVRPFISKVEAIFDDTDGWEELAQNAGLDGCMSWRQAATKAKESDKQGAVYYNLPPLKKSHGVYTNPYRASIYSRLRSAGINPQDARPNLSLLRMIKQPYELDAIHTAVQITHQAIRPYIENPTALIGCSEATVANAITAVFYQKNVVHAYEPIVAAGSQAAVLHHSPTANIINSNDSILFDIGAEYNGYAADISRTISANNTHAQQALINDIRAVQHELIQLVRPGYTWKELQRTAEQALERVALRHAIIKHQPIKELFPHSIGHFLGLDVHDAGDYSVPFQENMVITIEPGLYSKKSGMGVRIEDDIVITKTGAKIIN
jgi:Xaa-Pro aminopeptidase